MTTKRELLEAVAAGDLAPEEALRRLAELRPAAPAARRGRAQGLRVRVAAGTVDVVADPAVHEVVVEGAHRLVREAGGVLLVEGSDLAGGFSLLPKLSRRGQALSLRVAPDLPLDLAVDAGRVRVAGCDAALRLRVGAGSAELSDLRGGLDAEVDVGSVSLAATPRRGEWSLRTGMGKVNVALGAGSDVTVTARSELGKVKVPAPGSAGAHPAVEVDGRSLVLGTGAARLAASSDLGSVTVEVRS